MRKVLSSTLILVMLLSFVFASAGCGPTADYASPQAMYEAYVAGDNVFGKTVDVVATYDYMDGQIFDGPTANLGPTVYIQLTGKDAEKVKRHDDIVVKVKKLEYESKFSISFICETLD